MDVEPLTGKALQAVRHMDAKVIAWEGSVRAGKTIAEIITWMEYVRNGPPGPLAMIGKTARTVRQNLIDVMVAMVGDKRCRFVEGSGILHLFGRRIYVIGANDERSVTKIQGLTLAGALVDECATIPESFFNMLYSRLSVAGAKLFLTSNPASPAHWLKTKWLDRAKLWIDRDGKHHVNSSDSALNLIRVTFTIDDNPTLPRDYVEDIKASYTGLFYRRYILAEWVAAEGAIYDQFDPEKYVETETPLVTRWPVVGVDYGTKNPFVALLLGVGVDGRLHFASEYRWDSTLERQQKTDSEYSTALTEWIDTYTAPGSMHPGVHPERWVIDPSAASFIQQMWRDGYSPVAADNSVLDGIRLVSSLLSRDLIRINASCKWLIDEMASYSWDDKAAEKGEDKPVKVADHSCDAARYAIATTEWSWRHDLKDQLTDEAA